MSNELYRVAAFVLNDYDFVVVDTEYMTYLKLRNIGREIRCEIEPKVFKETLVLCAYDIAFLGEQVVVFRLMHEGDLQTKITQLMQVNIDGLSENDLENTERIFGLMDLQKFRVYKYLRDKYNYRMRRV